MESGLSFLRRIGLNQDRFVPRRLVIVGGGSPAFDCARTARRLGAEEVTIVYRRTEAEMPAGAEEIVEAVSYTHLDVYKRQPRRRPPNPRILPQ